MQKLDRVRPLLVPYVLLAAFFFDCTLTILATSVTLTWNANKEPYLAGYKVHYGCAPRYYGKSVNVGFTTTYTVTGLGLGTYHFAVTAYDGFGRESGFSNEVAMTITSASPPGAGSPTIPVAHLPASARIQNRSGGQFTTDVWLFNGSQSSLDMRVEFLQAGGDDTALSASRTLTLLARETRTIRDILWTLFSVSEMFGPIRFTPVGGEADKVFVVSRTSTPATDGASGTYGFSIDARPIETANTSPLFLVGLTQNAAFRTNLGIINPTPNPARYTITLYDLDGTVIGTALGSLLPNGTVQSSLVSLFQLAINSALAYEGLTVVVTPLNGVALAAYATTIDNKTGDGFFNYGLHVTSGLTEGIIYLPVVTKVGGLNETQWSSRLVIRNPDNRPITLAFSMHLPNSDNRLRVPVMRSISPQATLIIHDVIQELFQQRPGTYGALKIAWTSPSGIAPLVSSQTATPARKGLGTCGLQVDSYEIQRASSRQNIVGVRQDSAYRTNVGFVNVSALPNSLAGTLRASNGNVLGNVNLRMRPLDYFQIALDALFRDVSFLPDEVMTLEISAALPIFSYGTLIDNITQDPTFLPGK